MFDDMMTDIESNKKLSPIVTELFLRGRNLNILLVFILNATHYFIIKVPNERKFQQIVSSVKSFV